jgi:nuclear transport factor 2 (NTF2) superfamily protein
METTKKIVEAYVRYVKGWATIPNIKCPGQYEIDLLAIDPVTGDRYHIESGVSISTGFSKLTTKAFSTDRLKQRVEMAGQRRTLGYFVERKFSAPGVVNTLKQYGFQPGQYTKIIVTWGWTDEAGEQAKAHGVELWHFPDLMAEIATALETKRSYSTDDTMRTLHLFARGTRESSKQDKEAHA